MNPTAPECNIPRPAEELPVALLKATQHFLPRQPPTELGAFLSFLPEHLVNFLFSFSAFASFSYPLFSFLPNFYLFFQFY